MAAKIPSPRKRTYMRALLSHQKGRCGYCLEEIVISERPPHLNLENSREATLDHIIPHSKGGGNTWNNLILSCNKCNHDKGSKLRKPKIRPYNPSEAANDSRVD